MNKYFEKLLGENINLRVIVGSFFAMGIGLFLWYIHTLIIEPYSIFIRGLAETILIAGFVGIIYERFIKTRAKKEMENAILNALNADSGLLKGKKLNDEAINSIIKNCLHAKLCNEGRATALYDGLGLPSFSEEIFRDEFNYQIRLDRLESNLEIGGIVFRNTDYFQMREELMYTKRLHIKKNQELRVGLCFNEKHLEHYKGKDCIYRTILRINTREEKGLLEKIKANKEEILKIFSIETVKIDGESLANPTLRPYDDDKGIEIVYNSDKKKIGVKIEITIKSIRNKKINYYSAYLYDPTFNPKIRLDYCDEIGEVFPLAFFTSKSKGADKKPRPDPPDPTAKYCSIEINEWVFPTSGVVFVWKDVSKERKD